MSPRERREIEHRARKDEQVYILYVDTYVYREIDIEIEIEIYLYLGLTQGQGGSSRTGRGRMSRYIYVDIYLSINICLCIYIPTFLYLSISRVNPMELENRARKDEQVHRDKDHKSLSSYVLNRYSRIPVKQPHENK